MGKTFLARLLIDFLRLDRGDPVAFDLNPNGDALTDYFPALARPIDLGDQPLTGFGHDHFGFNDWEAELHFDNLKVTAN